MKLENKKYIIFGVIILAVLLLYAHFGLHLFNISPSKTCKDFGYYTTQESSSCETKEINGLNCYSCVVNGNELGFIPSQHNAGEGGSGGRSP